MDTFLHILNVFSALPFSGRIFRVDRVSLAQRESIAGIVLSSQHTTDSTVIRLQIPLTFGRTCRTVVATNHGQESGKGDAMHGHRNWSTPKMCCRAVPAGP